MTETAGDPMSSDAQPHVYDAGPVVFNPDAIGNPDEDPRVWVGGDFRALLNPCACGGVNGFHSEECTERR